MNWQDDIDGSFGDGPAHPPLEVRLAAGRRAVRRRRTTTLLAGTATALVLGAGGWAVTAGGATQGSQPPIASDATSPPTSAIASGLEISDDYPAAFDADGNLFVKDGWRVTQRVGNPRELEPPAKSLGLELQKDGEVRWGLLTWEPMLDAQGNPTPGDLQANDSWDPAGKSYTRLTDWLASMSGDQTPQLLTIDDKGRLHPEPGVTVLERVDDPPIEDYTGPNGVAVKTSFDDQGDSETWFVVIRRGGGSEPEYFPVDAGLLSTPTFEALYDHVLAGLDSGEGLK